MSGKRYMHDVIKYRVETSVDNCWSSEIDSFKSSIKISRNAVSLQSESNHFINNTKIVKRLAELLQ